MAKIIKKMPVNVTNKAGQTYGFVSEISVNDSGMFHATIPAELVEEAQKAASGMSGVEVENPRKHWRIVGQILANVESVLCKAAANFNECETVSDLMIAYTFNAHYCAAVAPDGKYHANRNVAPEGSRFVGDLDAMSAADQYGFGVAAKVVVRHTHRRESGDKVVYEYASFGTHLDDDHLKPKTWAGRLQIMVGLKGYRSWTGVKYIPYTEESARFFYDLMMGVAALSHRAEQFLGDSEMLPARIEQAASNSGIFALSAPENELQG